MKRHERTLMLQDPQLLADAEYTRRVREMTEEEVRADLTLLFGMTAGSFTKLPFILFVP